MHVSVEYGDYLLAKFGLANPTETAPKLTERQAARLKHSLEVKARIAKARRNTASLLWQLRRTGIRHRHADREHRFYNKRRWRFDLCWPHLRVAVEIHGMSRKGKGSHQYTEQFESDCEKTATAFSLGWTVVSVTPKMIKDGRAASLIAEGLASRMKG